MTSIDLKKLTFGLVLGIAACGGSAASQWEPKASAALHASPEEMLRNFDLGNVDALLARMDDDSVVLDFDQNNQPVRFEGRDRLSQYFGGLAQAMKTQGLKLSSHITRNDCMATASVGYCVIEFDQTVSQGGQTMGPFKFRATIVARKIGDDWRWTHWHGSFREMPAPAPSAPAGAREKASASR